MRRIVLMLLAILALVPAGSKGRNRFRHSAHGVLITGSLIGGIFGRCGSRGPTIAGTIETTGDWDGDNNTLSFLARRSRT